MNSTAFDEDVVLTDFLTDYLDGNLDNSEREVFEDYLDENKPEKEFTRKARQGKQALSWLAEQINNDDNPEYGLAKHIAAERFKPKTDTVN